MIQCMEMDAYWIAYKKVTRDFREYILTLGIPYDADVADASDCHGNIVRTSTVIVLKAENLDGSPTKHDRFFSMYDWNFQYKINQTIESPLGWTKGVYCFLTKSDAVRFMNRARGH